MTVDPTNSTGIAILSHSPRTNNPKLGGAGPLLSSEHCVTVDRTPHKAIIFDENIDGKVYRREECPSLRSPNTIWNKKLFDGLRIRRLTPTECERLQGFPDGWTEGVSDTQRYKLLGNAVTVNVVEFLGKKLRECLA